MQLISPQEFKVKSSNEPIKHIFWRPQDKESPISRSEGVIIKSLVASSSKFTTNIALTISRGFCNSNWLTFKSPLPKNCSISLSKYLILSPSIDCNLLFTWIRVLLVSKWLNAVQATASVAFFAIYEALVDKISKLSIGAVNTCQPFLQTLLDEAWTNESVDSSRLELNSLWVTKILVGYSSIAA